MEHAVGQCSFQVMWDLPRHSVTDMNPVRSLFYIQLLHAWELVRLFVYF